MYSPAFSRFYDQLMGDYSSVSTLTKQLVTKYAARKAHVLELGCGTGNILEVLKDNYILSGLDNSEAMLGIARKKIPKATFYAADMTTFSIPEKFGVILCIFDSINHLTTFTQWQRLFSRVNRHLADDGIFIFDMNTSRRLEALAGRQPYVTKIDKHSLACVKVSKMSKKLYAARFQVFENVCKTEVKYFEEYVYERAFETERVKRTLQRIFTIEKMIDPARKKITGKTGRIFFVCKKRK